MNLNEYQTAALKTAIYPRVNGAGVAYCTLGLASEAGEVAGKLKKIMRDCGGAMTDDNRHAMASELGDVLWYAATLAKELGYTLEEIAEMNLSKLADRANRGKIQGSGDVR